MTKDLPSFQQYQLAFTAHLRDPTRQAKPKNVVARGMNVYKEIVFNNLFESVSACFPIAQKVIGKRAWLKLVRDFFCEHSANTPIFRKIPEEFLSYLSKIHAVTERNLPPYLASLCHYEWVELLVATMPVTEFDIQNKKVPNENISTNINTDDLLTHIPILNKTAQLLNYDYAVQKISPKHRPKAKQSTQLLVYRNTEFSVKFMELNPMTFQLMTILQRENLSGELALQQLAAVHPDIAIEVIMQFGAQTLNELQSNGVVLDVKNHSK